MITDINVLLIKSTPTQPQTETVIEWLQQAGYQPFYQYVETPEAFHAALNQQQWDVILCDADAPQLCAHNILESLEQAGLDIPLIVMTSPYPRNEDPQAALALINAGAKDIIPNNRQTRFIIAITRELRELQRRRDHNKEALRFRALIENSNEAIALINDEGKVIYHSPTVARFSNFSLERLNDMTIAEFIHPDDLESLMHSFQKVRHLPPRAQIKGIFRFDDNRGNWNWIEFSAMNMLNDPNISAIIVNYQDITQRKLAEEARHQYAQRLKTLHEIDRAILSQQPAEEIANIALNYFAHHAQIWYASIALLDLQSEEGIIYSSYSQEHEKLWQTGTVFSLKEFSAVDIDHLKQGKIQVVEDITQQQDLSSAIADLRDHGMHSYATLPLMAHGELLGSFNLGANVPNQFTPELIAVANELANQVAIALHQKRLREQIHLHTTELEKRVIERTAELQRAKDHVEAILNHVSDAIGIINLEGVIWQTNPAFDYLFGYQVDELFRKKLVSLATPPAAAKLQQTIDQVMADKNPKRLELTVRKKDGKQFTAEFMIAAIIHAGEIRNLVCSIRDMSRHKEKQKDLRLALIKAQELNVLKTRFVSMVSHDFRNPLTVIRTSTEMLQRYAHQMDGEQRNRHFQKIQLQIQRMVILLNDVITVSQSDSGALTFDPHYTDLENFCHQIIEEFQSSPDVKHHLVYTCPNTPIWAMIDPKMMHHALVNLLTNAIKYSPHGSLILFELIVQDQKITIRVRDQGIGIPDADQVRLFEAFHRAQNVGDIEGSGLGLTIVKHAVDAHHGTIEVDSGAGRGTTVTISFAQRETNNLLPSSPP